MPQIEQIGHQESPPPTFSLKKYPRLCELFETTEIVFPRGGNPKGKGAQALRSNLGRYWVEGGAYFIVHFSSPERGKKLREEIDWRENEFQLKLRELSEVLRVPRDSLRETRQALLVGKLIEEEEVGERGVWVFTKQELLQLMVGAHAYNFARRKVIGIKH